MDYISTKEVSEKWGISQRRVAILCEDGRINGAAKVGKTWALPIDSEKPDDGRYKRMKKYLELYKNIEKKYEVVYPDNKMATYSSLLNYSDDLEKPYQRWYRYKEGFSIDLVKHLIKEYSHNKSGIILDPFAGSGSTLIAANQMGYKGVGFEVNPFSYFLADCKLNYYSDEMNEEFKNAYEIILKSALNYSCEYKLPKLSISEKVFTEEIEKFYMTIDDAIISFKPQFEETKNLLRLGWLSCLERVSNYRKAGNGLKIKKYVKPRILSKDDVYAILLEQYQNMYIDIIKHKEKPNASIYNESSLNMKKRVKDESITGIIFSPPYANCFDYTEIYKLELWFGGFVKEYSELKDLRKQSLHSHLNGELINVDSNKSETLNKLIKELSGKELWDKRIPLMLQSYYNDMFQILDQCYIALENKGFCCVVVGNSAYGGVVFPADLILSEYAESIGFIVNKIEVDRYIITSSQQYNMTKECGNYLRESVVCLIKKNQ
ncbi:MAG: DNA methyltransferase [Mobilitalea sp.]